MLLLSYEYKIRFMKPEAHADALSRLPLSVLPAESQLPPELVLLTEHLEESPVTARHIGCWTRRDPILLNVLRQVMDGWSGPRDSSLSVYYLKREELSVHQGCLL